MLTFYSLCVILLTDGGERSIHISMTVSIIRTVSPLALAIADKWAYSFKVSKVSRPTV